MESLARFIRPLEGACLIVLVLLSECCAWPEGTYGIPMPVSGCPHTKEFEWLTGSRIQRTEPESHASTPIHLAGIFSERTDKIVQNFCMKTSYPQYGDHQWEKGQYCLFKKGDCPRFFKQGWIYWDDAAPFFGTTIQNYSGTVPDGEYGRNTKIEFCCRKDGALTMPISLPTVAPFYLFRIGEGCQQVKNTEVTQEWIYWADEGFVNLSGEGGLYPKLQRSKHPVKFTKLYYCYYQPTDPPKTFRTLMTVIYCVAGIVSVLILAFVITVVVQKCCTRKQQAAFLTVEDSTAHEAMIGTAPSAGTELTDLQEIRRNGIANRNNELDSYTSADPPRPAGIVSPPRYSQVNKLPRYSQIARTDSGRGGRAAILADDRPASRPPSYEEVIKEDTEGGGVIT